MLVVLLAAIVALMPLATGSSSASAVSGPPAAAAASWSAPSFVRAMGARGAAGLYAWGVAYNPVSNEILVGDYRNFQVRRFSSGGSLLGSFYRPAADRRGVPEGIAVDPRDGSIYVSDHSRTNRGYVAKFSKTGAFICEFQLNASYQAWMAVDGDGNLYVSDSQVWHTATNPPQIRKYSLNATTATATEIAHWGTYGTGPGQIRWITGLVVDPSTGKVFVADTILKKVNVYAANGTFLTTIGAGDFSGDLRGIALNKDTRQLYVVDANAGEVERYNADTGASLGRFGSLGTGAGQFSDGGRQLAIDGSRNVWVADYGNARVLKFTATGSLVGAYPSPPQSSPAGAFSLVRDVAIDPSTDDVLAVEQDNHRLQRFRADGTPNGMWGRRSPDKQLGFNYPRGLAIQPGNERLWIANTTDSRVRVLNKDMTLALELGKTPGSGVGQFSEPIDIEFGNGKVYVGDANGGNVKILNPATGAEIGKIDKAAAGVAVDPATGDLYLSSWVTDVVYHLKADGTPATPAIIASPGTGPGQLVNPWDVDIIDGRLYVSDSERNVILVFSLSGSFLGEFGSAGSRPGQFNNPSGLTHDANGLLYVADAGNDRIVVFDPAKVAVPDSTPPVVTVGVPTPSTPITTPATLTGTVTDNTRVGTVEVAIQDRVTKLWWDARIATWSTTKQWTSAGVKGGSATSMQWWFPFIGAARRHDYALQVRAIDAAGVIGSSVSTLFKVSR